MYKTVEFKGEQWIVDQLKALELKKPLSLSPVERELRSTLKSMRTAIGETLRRCGDPNHRQYHYYGARGITVCPTWRADFYTYLSDMGIRPLGLTLERIDNNSGYSATNCKWATRKEQSGNTRKVVLVSWKGKSQHISAWEAELGFNPGTLKARLQKLGYSVEAAFTKPVKCGKLLAGKIYPKRRSPDMSKVPRGLAHKNISFTLAEVLAMRSRWLAGSSFSSLARERGLSVTTVSNACQSLGPYKGT
jgi:hypothetical protein